MEANSRSAVNGGRRDGGRRGIRALKGREFAHAWEEHDSPVRVFEVFELPELRWYSEEAQCILQTAAWHAPDVQTDDAAC